MSRPPALYTALVLLLAGCIELPTAFDTAEFSSVERTFSPGDTATLTLKTGWVLRVDATSAPEPYHVLFRDTPRRDWPSKPSASGVEVIYRATSGRAELNPPAVEVRFHLSRTIASSFVPRTGELGFVTAPPPANVFGFLTTTCLLLDGTQSKRVQLSTEFQAGPYSAAQGKTEAFGTRAHLGIAPYLFKEEYISLCRPLQS